MNLDATIDKVLERIDPDAVTRLAVDLVSIPSRTGEEQAAAEFLADYMRRHGLEVDFQQFAPGRANAVGVIRGEGDGPRLMFNGHLDTSITGVEADDYPMTGPLGPASRCQGFVQRGHVLGCGAYNMKGGIAAMTCAAIAVKQAGVPLRGELVVAGVAGEIEKAPVAGILRTYAGALYDGGGIGTRYLLNHGYLADYCLAPEPTHMGVLRSRLGLLFVKLTTRGDMVRACFPEKGKTAIGKMIQVITALENEFARDMARHAEAHEDALYTPGLSVGAIESGWPYKPWASPAVCCAYVDFRIPLGFTPLAAERALREFLRGLERRDPDLSVEMEVFLSKASNSTPRDSFVYRSCLRHYERLVGPYERSTHPLASYSDDTCIMREQAMDAVVFGAGGVRYRGLSDSEGLGIGGEAVRIDDLVQLARIYAATAVDVCGRSRDAIPSGADAAGAAGRAARVGS